MTALAPASNPFATRYVAPGAIPYRFPLGVAAESLAIRLRDQGWWGQIVGPHGAGKSTLLASLKPAIERLGRRVCVVSCNRAKPPAGLADLRAHGGETVLAIDGYEQLSGWVRWRLKRHCRRQDVGLLVTSHTPMGLPELYRVAPDLATFHQIVLQLTAPHGAALDEGVVTQAFLESGSNSREALFRLYDAVEAARAKA